MISMKYVNGLSDDRIDNSPFIEYETSVNTIMDDYNSYLASKKVMEASSMLEYEFTDNVDDNSTKVINESVADGIRKIGEVIIELGKKFIKLINDILDKIKGVWFSRKSDVEKLDKLIAKHPELKTQVIGAWKSGDLELSDMKTLAELDNEFNKIINLANKKDVDADSLRERWKRAMIKINNNPTLHTMKVASEVITLALLAKTFHSKCLRSKSDTLDSRKNIGQSNAKAYDYIMKNSSVEDNNARGKCAAVLAMHREQQGEHEKALRRNMNVINKMANLIADTVDKFNDTKVGKAITGDTNKNFRDNMNEEIRRLNAAAKKSPDEHIVRLTGGTTKNGKYMNPTINVSGNLGLGGTFKVNSSNKVTFNPAVPGNINVAVQNGRFMQTQKNGNGGKGGKS